MRSRGDAGSPKRGLSRRGGGSVVPREMFGDVVDPSVKVGTKQWYTVPLSFLVHTVVSACPHRDPVARERRDPDTAVGDGLRGGAAAAPPPPPPPPPPPAPSTPQPVTVAPNPNAAPVEAPKELKPEPPPAPNYSSFGAVGGVAGGIPGGSAGGIVGGLGPPPPPPPPAAPIRVGGDIKAPTKIVDVSPTYPQIARAARCRAWSSSRRRSPRTDRSRMPTSCGMVRSRRSTRRRSTPLNNGNTHADPAKRDARGSRYERDRRVHPQVAFRRFGGTETGPRGHAPGGAPGSSHVSGSRRLTRRLEVRNEFA